MQSCDKVTISGGWFGFELPVRRPFKKTYGHPDEAEKMFEDGVRGAPDWTVERFQIQKIDNDETFCCFERT